VVVSPPQRHPRHARPPPLGVQARDESGSIISK
jgi:hypothetical protein